MSKQEKKVMCPLCGKNHRFKHTAQACFQEVMMTLDMKVIGNNKLSKEEQYEVKVMKKYYFNLPMHSKHLTRG
jgi:hypothetical protein